MIEKDIPESNRERIMSQPMSVLTQLDHDILRLNYEVKSLKDRKGLKFGLLSPLILTHGPPTAKLLTLISLRSHSRFNCQVQRE